MSQCEGAVRDRVSTLVHVRRIQPHDAEAVLTMHERCSRNTRYLRWLGPSSVFPLSYLRSLQACTLDHLGVVAVSERQPARVVGLASAAATRDGGRELGILVEDCYQARGVGRLMLASLIELLDWGEPLYASALNENRWLFAKLARFGTVHVQHDLGVSYASVTRFGDVSHLCSPGGVKLSERK